MSPAVFNQASFGEEWSCFPCSRWNSAVFSYCELIDTGFDVLPPSTPPALTGNTEGCHTDTSPLWSHLRVDAAKISNCTACDLWSVSLSHISFRLFSQAPVMAPCWSITWPVASSTKNSVSTHVKSGKIYVSVKISVYNKSELFLVQQFCSHWLTWVHAHGTLWMKMTS